MQNLCLNQDSSTCLFTLVSVSNVYLTYFKRFWPFSLDWYSKLILLHFRLHSFDVRKYQKDNKLLAPAIDKTNTRRTSSLTILTEVLDPELPQFFSRSDPPSDDNSGPFETNTSNPTQKEYLNL